MLVGKLRLNIMLEKLQQHILVEFVTKLLVLKDYNSILIIYNRFLKILHFIAIIEKIIAKELAKLFRNNAWKLHELPESVISDRGP